ncbi:peptidoglycan-associated lipoprotein Pal [Persicimonas caeni]|uniref:Peptidoglycan-associated lipoprotein n=1 Tax=Persicimonas caeni TaxID=2292766 RepID=A0A4Y6Q148_PERCE|nr:peptidoglycan-associated lipoprotein Pal [Persicimonas caeni]QDG54306.1 peptidoglycan-associated lipoprotein Pal [Persicimonas caeni]QED35527.1 peptidoglycan-associated lipoprotein Pal [Persicimonas caeni]
MKRFNLMTLLAFIAGVMMLTGCPKPPKKALSDAQQALLDARGVKDCASDKFKAAQRLLDEAEELSKQEKYEEAERKAKAAQKLAREAKLEGEANWEDCQKKKQLADKAENPEPVEEEDEEVDEQLTLDTVYFSYDSSELSADARAVLDENVRWMKKHTDKRVVLEGHTDERGTPEYNLALGESRARRVKQYAVQMGVDGDRLSILSYGEEKPAAFGATASDYAKNRRVEFVPKN